MWWNRVGFSSERGLTLLEILFALAISGIFLVTTMRFLTDQWWGVRALKNHLEAHYAVMTAGKTVSDAIRTAKAVEWVKDSGVLKVSPMPDDANPVPSLDSYFVDDKDADGTKDLYWKRLVIPQPTASFTQPLASYISRWECGEVEPGLWEIFLQASIEGQNVRWRGVIRQRVYSLVSPADIGQPGMLVFSSFCF